MTDCILALDEGNEYTGWAVVTTSNFDILEAGKTENEELRKYLYDIKEKYQPRLAVIEAIESYGMAVGRTVFHTCIWAGRFVEVALRLGMECEWISRKEEKLAICGSMKANDATIKRALIDRFARFDMRAGKGNKNKPDFFYGFKADMWSAFAIAYTYLLKEKGLA